MPKPKPKTSKLRITLDEVEVVASDAVTMASAGLLEYGTAKVKVLALDTDQAKRGPGRPATGRTTETRGVTLSNEDWAWVDAQGGSRSKVIADAIAHLKAAQAKSPRKK